MSAQLYRPGPEPEGRLSLEEIQRKARGFEQRFQEMSEEEQDLYLLSQRLSNILGLATKTNSRENIARSYMTYERGPKFAERMLADPKFRKRLGIDREVD